MRRIAVAAGVVALVFLSIGLNPAGAHEITVAVAISTTIEESGTVTSDLRDGLRLAIDQSPDIGHAPGSEAGDHLGGVDVELIDGGDIAIAEVADFARQTITGGASILVVVGDAGTITATAAEVDPESGFLVALLTGQGEVDSNPPIAVLRPASSGDSIAYGEFAEAFEATFARAPSESAANGFDIGQLLDSLIGHTDGAIPDAASLQAVTVNVNALLTSTELDPVKETQAATVGTGSRDRDGVFLLAGVVATVAVLVVSQALRRRKAARDE